MKNHCSVAIVGGSFAGLSALLMLRKRLGNDIGIKLFDSRENFTHIPGLPEAILDDNFLPTIQISKSRYYPNEFIHEKVTAIQAHQLTTESGTTRTFDYAVIATGSRTNFFGNKQFEEHAYTVSYPEDIPKLNKALEKAKNITVIGGGYTGIEIATIIAERKKHNQHVRVIHARERLFNRLSPKISRIAKDRLKKNNIELLTSTKVTTIEKKEITLDTGKKLPSDVTIAARGITANDETHLPWLTFKGSYTSLESDRIFMCGDVAVHGLYTTGHNAMIEGRRIGNLIADKILGVTNTYSDISNRDKLAISLGRYDGILTNGEKGIYVPYLMGIFKWFVQIRVLLEFKYKILIPV